MFPSHSTTLPLPLQALSKDAKVFGGKIMVGVRPCIDLDFTSLSKPEPVAGVLGSPVPRKQPRSLGAGRSQVCCCLGWRRS